MKVLFLNPPFGHKRPEGLDAPIGIMSLGAVLAKYGNTCRCVDHVWEREGNWHARVDTVDEDLIKTMKEAHCTGAAFGIESGNSQILKAIDKRITLEQAHQAVRLCRKYGITTLCSYIFGHPGDTHKTVSDTLRAAIEIDSDYANFCVLVPMPGSRVFEELRKSKEIKENHWDSYLAHARTLPKTSVCELTPSELQTIQKRAFRRFYFRSKYILRSISHVRSLRDLFDLMRGLYVIILFHLQVFLRVSNKMKDF